jgi:hypothetical protein
MVAPAGGGGGRDRSRAGYSSVNPRWPQESAALLGFGTTLVEGERTGEVLTFRSRRLHYTIAEQVLS